MQKVNILVLLFFFNGLLIQAQFENFEVKRSLKTMNLKGQVSNAEFTTRTIHGRNDKSVDTNNWLKSIYYFDKNGNCIEEIDYTYKSNGLKDTIIRKKGNHTETLIKSQTDTVRTSHILYRYDEHQRPIETIKRGENNEFRFKTSNSYTYDKEGRMATSTINFTGSDGGKLHQKYSYEYLENGDFKCEIVDLLDGQSYGWRTYNKYGVSLNYNIATTRTADQKGGFNTKKIDERGNIIEETYVKGDTVFTSRIYKFDQNGNLIERKDDNFYKKTKSLQKFMYDANNNEIRHETYDYKNKKNQLFVKEYDQYNNETKTIFYKSGKWNKIDFIINYYYKYDTYGNWISKHKKPTSKYSSESIQNRKFNFY